VRRARVGRHPSFAEFADEGFVFCDKAGKSRSLSGSKGERERDDIFTGVDAVAEATVLAAITAMHRAFCYAGFLGRMRWRERIF
jgi:hypothetical protein